MRICFYSPYLPNHFGGGEKHLFDVALSAARYHQVFIAVGQNETKNSKSLEKIKAEYKNFFNIDLSSITFISTPLGSPTNFLEKLNWTKQFDSIYYVTDGSLFFSLAPHNYLHIQIPFTSKKNSFLERLKLDNWGHKNTNSIFTKSVIEASWNTSITEVIQPMVDLQEFNRPAKKQKIILSVGRFFRQLHSKRQDVLIDCFKELCKRNPQVMKNWQLILVGSIEDREYVKELEQQIGSANIKMVHSINRNELVDLYLSATMYWHATGYEIDENKNPEKVEHFGISTVEAMAAGAIPIVQYKGGQKEILGENLKELGWFTKEDCINKTSELIHDLQQTAALRQQVLERASEFSKLKFEKKIEEIFSK